MFDTLVDEICNNLAETLKKKNHDYGNSLYNQIKKRGDIAGYLRLEEKLNRLESLIDNDALVNESTDDTLLDTAGYSILILTIHKMLEMEARKVKE